MQTTIRLSSRNQIVLPRDAREAMHLKGRDELLEVLSGAGQDVYPNVHLKKERKAW